MWGEGVVAKMKTFWWKGNEEKWLAEGHIEKHNCFMEGYVVFDTSIYRDDIYSMLSERNNHKQ